MSQQLSELFDRSSYREPEEIKLIKEFVKNNINITPKVSISSETFIVSLPSAAAAGVLRPSLYKLQQQLNTEKRIIIRIA